LQKYEHTTIQWKEITDSASVRICFLLYSREGFCHLVVTLDPTLSAKYVSSPSLYEKTRERIAAEIKKCPLFSSIIDVWSSSTMEPYLNYSVYYINDDWVHQSLLTPFIPRDHKADNLSEVLKETLAQWGLEADRQVCITQTMGAI